ncbi:hypothetical protein KAT36_04585 [Candidatus Pacearchaeota archaeon]|nr:hypothetical protein [Candidatus Pacearchaeota archaeon]
MKGLVFGFGNLGIEDLAARHTPNILAVLHTPNCGVLGRILGQDLVFGICVEGNCWDRYLKYG